MFMVVTGGSGSGKSEYAENQVVKLRKEGAEDCPLYYIATMYPFDKESDKRIARHREMRKEKHFETVEQYTGLDTLCFPKDAVVLLECMSNWVANEIYQPDGAGEYAAEAVKKGLESLRRQCRHLVVVTNEVFSDGIQYEKETIRYQSILGEINCHMAKEADRLVEVVYGIPLYHKGGEVK